MGVSINGGTPKMKFKMENAIEMDDLGVPPWLRKPPCLTRRNNFWEHDVTIQILGSSWVGWNNQSRIFKPWTQKISNCGRHHYGYLYIEYGPSTICRWENPPASSIFPISLTFWIFFCPENSQISIFPPSVDEKIPLTKNLLLRQPPGSQASVGATDDHRLSPEVVGLKDGPMEPGASEDTSQWDSEEIFWGFNVV